MNEVVRNNVANVKEHENESVTTKCNNKVGIAETELIERKWLVIDSMIDTKWVWLEHNKSQNKCSFSKLRHEELVEKSKWDSHRAILKQEEEESLGVEDAMEKIEEEHKL